MDKSKLHVSRNVDSTAIVSLSQLFGVSLTNGLCTYLDIPLFHGRVHRGTFEHLLTKCMQI